MHIDGEALRSIMRRVPSPVVVVTAAAHEVRGATIGSFTSVSLTPPLISFNVAVDSQMYPVITAAERFAVHVLREEQAELSRHFALPDLPGKEQFLNVPHRKEEDGLPILFDALGILLCRRYAIHPAGDHAIIVGKVESVEEQGAGRPILYYNRSYRALGDVVMPAFPLTTNLSSKESPAAPDPKNA